MSTERTHFDNFDDAIEWLAGQYSLTLEQAETLYQRSIFSPDYDEEGFTEYDFADTYTYKKLKGI